MDVFMINRMNGEPEPKQDDCKPQPKPNGFRRVGIYNCHRLSKDVARIKKAKKQRRLSRRINRKKEGKR